MDSKIKVLVVEDEVMIAKHIEDTLISNGYTCLGITHDSASALEYIHNRQPELILLDINIDGDKDGIEIAQIVKSKYDIPYIFLTALSDTKTLDRAKKVNPCGYIVKPFKAKGLLSSITIGLYNYEFNKKSEPITISTVNEMAVQDLSPKEFEVLLDLKDGLTNAQIAKKQYLAISTIKFHCQNIYMKLEVKNRTSAVKKVLRH